VVSTPVCIIKVAVHILAQIPALLAEIYFVIPSVPSGKGRDTTSNYSTTASFYILSNSVLINNPTIRRYTISAFGSFIKELKNKIKHLL
jgi:hypothetical protein